MPAFKEVTPQQLLSMSPLQLAFIGDSVYDLFVRGHMLKTMVKPQALHRGAAALVNATAQASTMRQLEPYLTEEERDYARKGRNAQPRHSAPKSATCADYAAATGFEAMIGYLYVTGQEERLTQLISLALTLPQADENAKEK